MNDNGGFPSIHPPSLVRVIDDCRPPSPLSSAPNTPPSSRSKKFSMNATAAKQGKGKALQPSSNDLSIPKLRRAGDTPFDEPADELPISPKEQLQNLTPRRGRTTTSSTSSNRVKLTPSPKKKKKRASPTPKPKTPTNNSPRRNIRPTETPSTLRMMALLTNNDNDNDAEKQPTEPSSIIVRESPRSPPMRTTRQFDRTYVPTIVDPALDARPTLQSINDENPHDETSPRNKMNRARDIDAPHDESPTKQGLTTTTALVLQDNNNNHLLCDDNIEIKCIQISPHHLFQEDLSSCSDDFDFGRFLREDDVNDDDEDVIDLLMSDAAYFTNAAANMSYNFSSVLSDAGTAMEQFVLGPPKVAKTPEQTAAEWRRRKRLAMLESKAQASNMLSPTTQYLPSNGVAIDDDDRTAVANNRDRCEIISDIPKDVSAKNPTPGKPTGGITVTPAATPAQPASTVSALGTETITGWWLNKERASHDQKVTTARNDASGASSTLFGVSTVSNNADDISEITDDSDQKQKKEQRKVRSEKSCTSLTVLMESSVKEPSLVKNNSAGDHKTTKTDSTTDQPMENMEADCSTNRKKENISALDKMEAIHFSASKDKKKESARTHTVTGQSTVASTQKTEVGSVIKMPNATKRSNDPVVDTSDRPIIFRNPVYDSPKLKLTSTNPPSKEKIEKTVVNANEVEDNKVVPSNSRQLGSVMEIPTMDALQDSPFRSVDLRILDELDDLPTFSTTEPNDETISATSEGKNEPYATPSTCADRDIKANGVSRSSRTVLNTAPIIGSAATQAVGLAKPLGNGTDDSLPYTTVAHPLERGEITGIPIDTTLTNTGKEKKNQIALSNTADKWERLANVLKQQTFVVAEEQLDPIEYSRIDRDVVEIQGEIHSDLNPIATPSKGLSKSVLIKTDNDEEVPPLHSFTSKSLGLYKVIEKPSPEILDKSSPVVSNRVAQHEFTKVPLSVLLNDDIVKDNKSISEYQGGAVDRDRNETGYHDNDENDDNDAEASEDDTNEEGNDEEDDAKEETICDEDDREDDEEFIMEKDVDEEEDLVEDEGDNEENGEDDVASDKGVCQSNNSISGARSEDVSVSVSMVSSMAGQSVETAITKASDVTLRRTNETPVMIKSIDDINGIVKGDVLLSLVKTTSEAVGTTGSSQVVNAVWRMRTMRRKMAWKEQIRPKPELEVALDNTNVVTPTKKRSSLPVDIDDFRVIGGVKNVETLEAHAVEHLQADEIEEAQELYEEIILTYTETFKAREKAKAQTLQPLETRLDYRPYIGNALHNLGILHFLNGDFAGALSFFVRARESRKSILGENHADYLTTYTKCALCHYALDDFDVAHIELENALRLCKGKCQGITDFMQIAEILNNLGVLTFMCGDPNGSLMLFKESLDVQRAILNHSLYGGSALAGHGINLNVSVTRGNIGFVKLVSKKLAAALVAFESALMYQQMLLNDSHETLIGTMDHLVVVNSLSGKKSKALKMLSRMLRAQVEAHGSSDPRCIATMSKLRLIEAQEKDLVDAVEGMSKAYVPVSKTSENEVQGPINLIELTTPEAISPPRAISSPTTSTTLSVQPQLTPTSSRSKSVLHRLISKRRLKEDVKASPPKVGPTVSPPKVEAKVTTTTEEIKPLSRKGELRPMMEQNLIEI